MDIDPDTAERLVRGMMREGFAMRGEIGAHTKLADLDITIVVPPGWVAPSDAAAVAVAAWCALRWWANCQWMVGATPGEAAEAWTREARVCSERARTSFSSDDAGCLLRDERRAAAVAHVIRSRPDAWRAVLGLLADSDSESYGARLYALMDGAYPGWRELPAADDCARKARGNPRQAVPGLEAPCPTI